MSTSGPSQLPYIRELESRLRLGAILRGGAILTSVALAATVLLVFVANLFAFSDGSLTGARVALLLALAFAVGFGLAIPLYGLDRRRAAGKGEEVFPKFQQRLVTFAERDTGAREPFLDLLAADTLDIARDSAPSRVFPDGKLVGSLVLGVASLGVLLWMIIAGPGYLGHGAALLWTGSAHGAAPLYNLQVTPGDASVRRNTDEVVTAQITGLQPNNVRLYARSQSTSKWEQLSMQPQAGASGFQFTFAAVPEGIEYYVEAGPLHSRHFNIKVVDVPVVKQIRVTYKYPSWTGMPSTVDEHGGDLHAVEGTDADLELQMDRPLRDGMLVLDNGQQLQLAGGEGNVYKGTVHIDKDGSYHVATLDQGQQVRLSDDFFIESNKANAPEVRITRPTGDYRASPIEEVTVAIKASDEFGINELMVHYSVNGGPEKTVNVLKQKGAKDTDGSTMISLEDFKLVPGDLISLYATAKDARTESRTDMAFVQADPFEREFSQSQQAGGGQGGAGGGGGGQDPEQISQREKEIIAETWKNQGDKTAAKDQLAENAKFLSGVQSKLRDQALSLAGRLQARELTDQNQEFTDFQKDMNDAAESMDPASQKLQQQKWNDAISNEQKALQHLLRAEATFRQIVVAFGSRGGGGGAGGGAGRDLQSLFDLELDTEKNQFETGQTASSQDQRSQDIDDALQKLDQLTKRQQELAAQQHNGTQTEAERWQQEMLRRDAEELQRQMEQLAQKAQQEQQQGQQQQGDQSGQQAQGGQQGQQGQGQPGSQQGSQQGSQASAQGGAQGSSQGKPSPTGQAGQSGQAQSGQASQADATGAQNSGVQQALDRLRQAQQDMERAASQPQQQGQDAARSAADKLQEATKALGGSQAQQSSQQLDSLARQADRLTGEQRDQADRMRKVFGADGNAPQTETSGQDLQKLADDRQGLTDELARWKSKYNRLSVGCPPAPLNNPLSPNCARPSAESRRAISKTISRGAPSCSAKASILIPMAAKVSSPPACKNSAINCARPKRPSTPVDRRKIPRKLSIAWSVFAIRWM